MSDSKIGRQQRIVMYSVSNYIHRVSKKQAKLFSSSCRSLIYGGPLVPTKLFNKLYKQRKKV